jgi:hypothetical protein
MWQGATSHNRSVYASPPLAARGSIRLGRYAPTAYSTHIFASPRNLRFPLSGLQKRHIQPERYVQLCLKSSVNIKSIYNNIFKGY